MRGFTINLKPYITNVFIIKVASEQLESAIEPYIHSLKDDDNSCY